MEASSWAMRAPRSFLASSSRSMASIFSFLAPTWIPPAALISAMASLAPSRMEAPMGAEPPVKGPVMAILTVSWAWRPEGRGQQRSEKDVIASSDPPERSRTGGWKGGGKQ